VFSLENLFETLKFSNNDCKWNNFSLKNLFIKNVFSLSGHQGVPLPRSPVIQSFGHELFSL
jgi:hypothetical protein